MKRWVYHLTEAAKIIADEDLAAHLKDGWAESPVDLVKKPVRSKEVSHDSKRPDNK